VNHKVSKSLLHSGQNNGPSSVKTNRKSNIMIKKITENPKITNHFIVFYNLYDDSPCHVLFLQRAGPKRLTPNN